MYNEAIFYLLGMNVFTARLLQILILLAILEKYISKEAVLHNFVSFFLGFDGSVTRYSGYTRRTKNNIYVDLP